MLENHSVLAVVPARGGSKSIPNKNIKPLAGKPLITWSIDVAKSTREIDRVIVSTDDDAIASVSLEAGAEIYRRPAHLATDEALVIDALRDLISTLKSEGKSSDILVLLEPTSPLRTTPDIRACLQLLSTAALDSVATFKEASLNPHRAWKIVEGKPEVFIPGAIPWLPRQKLPKAYQLTGAVYAFRAGSLLPDSPSLLVGKAGAIIMPKDRSVDIDDEADFALVENLLRRKNR